MKRYRYIIITITLILPAGVLPLAAQTADAIITYSEEQPQSEVRKPKRAWEFGLGASVFQFNRTSFSNFTQNDQGYLFDLDLRHALWGGNLYVAHELSKHFYLDLQGSIGSTTESISANGDRKWLYTGGLGLQWRLGEYFKSKYIDPYLRVGGNYMYKDFDILYTGKEGLTDEEMNWVMENYKNKEGADKKSMVTIALGGGVNMWLNNSWGIGIQADYLLMPYTNVANSLQGTVRVMYRLGGKSKKTEVPVRYIEVEKIVERIVEKPVVVEVETIVPDQTTASLCEMFNNITFDFDKDILTKESEDILDRAAHIMNDDTSKRYLITGYTDAKGSPEYNLVLSKKRAKAVVNALLKRGIPASMMKSRGVGRKISHADASASDVVRRGDRKVTIEVITNADYWNYLAVDDL